MVPFCDLNNDPRYGWLEMNVSVIKSFSPTLEMNTLYLVELDNKVTQYSLPPSTYTGALNWIFVATDPSPEVWISSGSKTTSEKGRTFVLGRPFSIVLICIITGISMSSFDLKKTSQLVKNTPVVSSIINDWDKGSLPPPHLLGGGGGGLKNKVPTLCVLFLVPMTVLSTTSVPRSLLTFVLWNCSCSSTLAFLTEIIFSWTVSNVPEEEKPSSAIVTALSWLLSMSSVKVNTLLPVSNLGKLILFGSGIK